MHKNELPEPISSDLTRPVSLDIDERPVGPWDQMNRGDRKAKKKKNKIVKKSRRKNR